MAECKAEIIRIGRLLAQHVVKTRCPMPVVLTKAVHHHGLFDLYEQLLGIDSGEAEKHRVQFLACRNSQETGEPVGD